MSEKNFGFKVTSRLSENLGRVGVINTPHGEIQTPAFIPVGTKATVKSVVPEAMKQIGAQALLANAYHLYLQPSSDLIDEAGGLGKFMNWPGPTFTDSGGFQVLSLGVGFKKVLAMDPDSVQEDDVMASEKERLALVDDDGVNFKSHLDGNVHRFTPEVSMQVQHQIGADLIFAFDECTTLKNTREYQEQSLVRTLRWAERCVIEHQRLTKVRADKPYQALLGVIQGAQYQDLRRGAAKDIANLDFDGFGIGGAIDKNILGLIVRWVNEELPENKPRHLLGIGEPDDLFEGVENGADTFDCVAPSRNARNAAAYSQFGRYNISNNKYQRDFSELDKGCNCYTCANYTKAYLQHLFRAKEMLASTLLTIHNLHFIVSLVDKMRVSIIDGTFFEFKKDFLGRYYAAI